MKALITSKRNVHVVLLLFKSIATRKSYNNSIMGKKGKKNNEALNSDLLSYEGKQELEDNNFNSETNHGTDSVKKKKKNRKRNLDDATKEDLSVHIKDKEIDISTTPEPTFRKIKKEKMKKHNKLNKQELCVEVQNDNHANTFSEDQPPTSKKKKKSNKMLDKKDEMAIDISPVSTEENKGSKKKKNEDGSLNDEKGSKTQNVDVQQSKKKRGKKAKTGAPVFNDDEAQVTEEDIDRFIDELDEEDNKQYEDWVKLLDARLSKK